MRLFIATLILSLLAAGADAQPSRRQFTVPTPGGQILIVSFGDCAKPTCPAVLILSGSKGFAAPAYDEIGRAFKAAGLNAYLVHVLSPGDLGAMQPVHSFPPLLLIWESLDRTFALSTVSISIQNSPNAAAGDRHAAGQGSDAGCAGARGRVVAYRFRAAPDRLLPRLRLQTHGSRPHQADVRSEQVEATPTCDSDANGRAGAALPKNSLKPQFSREHSTRK
jgi:hypothetical protein